MIGTRATEYVGSDCYGGEIVDVEMFESGKRKGQDRAYWWQPDSAHLPPVRFYLAKDGKWREKNSTSTLKADGVGHTILDPNF